MRCSVVAEIPIRCPKTNGTLWQLGNNRVPVQIAALC
jgi:hypothetical protein